MKRNYRFLKTIAAAFFGISSIAVNAQLTIIANSSYETGGITNSGVVVMNTSGGTYHTWSQANGIAQIGALSGGSFSGKSTISNDGTRISAVMTNTTSGNTEIALYNVPTTTWTNLGSLGAASGNSASSTWGMSGDGNTIVGLGWISAGTAHAVKWTSAGGVVDLGSIVAGRSSRANAVNNDGSVIVGWQDEDSGGRRGAKWVDGVETFILDNTGNTVGEASGVSADGKTIIGQGIPNPYVWNEVSGLTDITHPNAGPFFRGGATAVSADGNTVIGYYRGFPAPPMSGEGFIWTPAGGRVNLNTYATTLGINTLGVTMSLPLAISPDGKKIAGIGVDSSNAVVTFYLDLTAYLSTNEGIRQSNTVTIYPNPVKDILYIKGAGKIEKAEIYNMVGQKVRSFNSGEEKIDVSSLSKGNYILEYVVKGESASQSFKFIKQ
jgi:Predicted integral membrane proteins containing uncharacterized repeats